MYNSKNKPSASPYNILDGPPVNMEQANQQTASSLPEKEKYKAQSQVLMPASFVLTSGGMSMAWALGFRAATNVTLLTTHFKISWFIAALIGALIAAALVNKLQKKVFFIIQAVLVIIGGILFVSLPLDLSALIAGQYFDGLAFGMTFVAAVIMGGEVAAKNFRGKIGSMEQMAVGSGIFLQLFYNAIWPPKSNFTADQMHGAFIIALGVGTLLTSICLVIESPVFLLQKGNEAEAIDSLRKLTLPNVLTQETNKQLEEHKKLVAENNAKSLRDSLVEGVGALIKLSIFRVFVAMSFANPLSTAVIVTSVYGIGEYAVWPIIVFGVARSIGPYVAAATLDRFGRKKTTLLGLIPCAGLAIGVGILFSNENNLVDTEKMTTAFYLLVLYQYFAGVFTPASSVYLSEAYPLAAKPFYIAIAFAAEMLVQIIIIFAWRTSSPTAISLYNYSLGSMLFVYAIVFCLAMPETKQTSLREAQMKFRS